MNRCPSCYFPYEDGMQECPNCFAQLNSGSPPPPESKTHFAGATSNKTMSKKTPLGAILVQNKDGTSSFVLQEGRTKIGREPSNDIVITDDKVSGQHATIMLDGKRDRFIDDSANGSEVNGELIHCDMAKITHGTVIKLHNTTLYILLLSQE